MTSVKVLVAGSAAGRIVELFTGITKINAKYGPFELLLCTGDLFGNNTDEINSLLSGEVEVPITTYFMYGKDELPDIVKERVESNDGEFCPNLFYLGCKGSITTTHGVKIAFISGILKSLEDDIPTQVDILLTYEWPKNITRFSSGATISGSIHESQHVAELAANIKPKYHFANSENVFFKREPYQNALSTNLINENNNNPQLRHLTWFVSLADVCNSNKAKWYFGFNLTPFMHSTTTTTITIPENVTECPFIFNNNMQQGHGRKRGLNDAEGENYFWSTDDLSEPSTKRGRIKPGPPPSTYVCNKCNLPGHWITECPTVQGRNKERLKRPPKQYICKTCNEEGTHYFVDCPNYQCKICGMQGHPPKNCPSHNSTSTFKKSSKALPCWFCLSNPKTVKHLIVSLGGEVYLSLAKGSLIDTQDPSISIVPGGGHVLLIAIAHCPTFREIPSDDQVNMMNEMEKYKSSLKRLFQEYGAGMLLFEVSLFGGKHQHCHVQIVPVPFAYDSEKIREAFLAEAKTLELTLQLIEGPSNSLPESFFKVDLPDGTSLVHEITRDEHFDVQFGRRVICNLLGLSSRINWRDCELSEVLEREDAEKFRNAFLKYDPMAHEKPF